MPVFVPLDRITDSPFQTRSRYAPDAVEALADAIERDSMLQTPPGRLAHPNGKALHAHPLYAASGDASERLGGETPELGELGRVQLAFGHTRARAWRLIWERRAGDQVASTAGVHGVPFGTMPVELKPLSDDAMARLAWTENHDRSDLDPVDRAAAIAARVERHGWTHEQAGAALGLDRTTVSNILRWYQAFSADETGAGDAALEAVRSKAIAESTARPLASLFLLAAEHPAIYADGVTERNGVASLNTLAEMVELAADPDVSAEDIRFDLKQARKVYESEAARIEQEQNPPMFADEPNTKPAGPDTAEAPAGTEDGIAEDLDDIEARHSHRINWITDAGQVTKANDERLGSTLSTLRQLARRCDALVREMDADQTLEHGARLERISGSILFDVQRIEREVARRDDAYDDGGARLGAIASNLEGEFAQPLPEADGTEREHSGTGEEMVEVEADTASAWSQAEAEAVERAAVAVLATIPEPARVLLTPLLCVPSEGTDTTDAGAWAEAAARGSIREYIRDESPRATAEECGLDVEWPDVSADTPDLCAEAGAPEPEGPEPYAVRAMAFEGVATIRTASSSKSGSVEQGVERFFDAKGHQWAVVVRLGGKEASDDGPLRWNVVHVETGYGLMLATDTPGAAEFAARGMLHAKSAEEIAESVGKRKVLNPTPSGAEAGDGQATETAPEVAAQ